MIPAQAVAAAWLAGIRHVLSCRGCELCLLPEALNEKRVEEEDEKTLAELASKVRT